MCDLANASEIAPDALAKSLSFSICPAPTHYMEALTAPVSTEIPTPSYVSASSISPSILEIVAPAIAHSAAASLSMMEIAPLPRVHYAPASPGIQQSQDGDLSLLSFEAIDDYLSLSGTDVTFTLQNSGVAAADSFTVDILHTEDTIIGNSDDRLIERFVWTALSDEAAQGIVRGVDAGYGYSAAISNLDSGTYPVTAEPNSGNVFISFTPEPRRE